MTTLTSAECAMPGCLVVVPHTMAAHMPPTSPDPSEAAVTEGPDPLADDDLDDLREHFVNGSGAYTDSVLVGRLVLEIDRLRSQPSAPERPDLTAEKLFEYDQRAGEHRPFREQPDWVRGRYLTEAERIAAALRAEQVERPSLDVADVTELRELAAGATAAPWVWLDGDDSDPDNPGDELQDGHGEMVATGFRDQVLRDGDSRVTDGRFVAALRNAWPAIDAALSGAAAPAERTRE